MRLERLPFTVAICTLNRCGYLRRAVQALLEQLRDFTDGRLLVVDNGSTDGTEQYLRRLQESSRNCAFVREPVKGLYYARVRAIREFRGDFVIFLDDDAVPARGWLEGMLRALTESPEVGIVGCAIDPIWEGTRPAWLSDRLMREIPVYEVRKSEEAAFPCYPAGIALGLRRDACMAIYSCPQRLHEYPLGRQGTSEDGRKFRMLGGEDTDLCEIYARNGFRIIFTAGARVGHVVSKERLERQWYIEKLESEGHLRIRLLRLTGSPLFSRHSIKVLTMLPALALMQTIPDVLLSGVNRVLIRAQYRKCVGAWRELMHGPRLRPLPYLPSAATPSGDLPKCNWEGRAA
jgi:glycosyltransferase involved in cell wall biosynthesis